MTDSSLNHWAVQGHDSFDGAFYSLYKPIDGKLCPAEFPNMREAVAFAMQQHAEFKRTEHIYGSDNSVFIINLQNGSRYRFASPEDFARIIEEEERQQP